MTETEIGLLKQRATQMGIKFHPSIGVKTLRDKVNAKLTKTSTVEEEPEVTGQAPIPIHKSDAQLKAESRIRLRKEANRLIRVKISCMNTNKKDWPGEIFSVSNRTIGTIKKFVPFNAEEGWHVPNALLTLIQERKFQTFKEIKLSNGRKQKKGFLVKEFSVDILDPLTHEELKDLAQRQAIGNRID